MMFVYTGDTGGPSTVDLSLEGALLAAADQYLLEKLKRACEESIAARLTSATVLSTFELAEQYNAKMLANRASVMVLENYEELSELHGSPYGYAALVSHMRGTFEEYVPQILLQAYSPAPTPEAEQAFAPAAPEEAVV